MGMNLYDIKEEEEWQQILDELMESLSMPTALVDPQSFVLQESGQRHELCKAIRAKKDSLIGICAQTQKYMAKQASETKRPVLVSCEAGMSKCLIPVFSGDEFMGSVVVCGTAIPGKEIPTAMIAENIDMGEDEVIRLSGDIPVMAQEEVSKIADETFHKIHLHS